MTREEAKELLPVLTAWANGEEVQFKVDDAWLNLYDCNSDPSFSDPARYRVKPKPRTFWVNAYSDGSFGQAHETRRDADTAAIGSRRIDCLELVEKPT